MNRSREETIEHVKYILANHEYIAKGNVSTIIMHKDDEGWRVTDLQYVLFQISMGFKEDKEAAKRFFEQKVEAMLEWGEFRDGKRKDEVQDQVSEPKFDHVDIPKTNMEFNQFVYWLRDVGEITPDKILQTFEKPEPYQKLWNAWLHYHREGFENWQIEQKLDDASGGWNLEVKA